MSESAPHPVPRFLLQRAASHPEATLCVVPEAMHRALPGGRPHPEATGWWTVGVREAVDQVAGLARHLQNLGVQKGDRVAIVAETSHLWAAADLAILSLGAVTVGLYTSLPSPKLAALLQHCGARLVLFDDQHTWRRFREAVAGVPLGARVFYAGGPIEALTPESTSVAWLEEQVRSVDPHSPATIVYTSGTTGDSKGAVLTHAAFHHVVSGSRDAFPTEPGDRSVVFLPMAHVLQRFATYRGLVDGVEGWYAPDVAGLPDTILAARPQILIAVPRVLEKIRQQARQKAEQRGALALFDWATDIAQRPEAARFATGREWKSPTAWCSDASAADSAESSAPSSAGVRRSTLLWRRGSRESALRSGKAGDSPRPARLPPLPPFRRFASAPSDALSPV